MIAGKVNLFAMEWIIIFYLWRVYMGLILWKLLKRGWIVIAHKKLGWAFKLFCSLDIGHIIVQFNIVFSYQHTA